MTSHLALLDVNVLIALFDDKHQYHQIASDWLIAHIQSDGKWASCPITQNGCLRILSSTHYPNRFELNVIKTRLQQAIQHENHVFIADTVSLVDESIIDWRHIQGHKQLTDAYLLGLVDSHNAIFVTFDNRISTHILTSKNNRIIYLS